MMYGWIGLGNMAQAIIKGMLATENYDAKIILAYNRSQEKVTRFEKEYGIVGCRSVEELLDADVIVLGVQPQQLEVVYAQLVGQLKPHQVVVSMAAGKTIAQLQQGLNHQLICRVMPNINAIVGASTTGFASAPELTNDMKQAVRAMFEAVGSVIEIPEEQFDVFSAIAGASPAFTYLYIDSLARAAVMEGMDKGTALQIAASAVLGSAEMVLQSNEHPWALVDQVCSPGGTTIQGVTSLQNNHFASTIYEAVQAVIARDRVLK